MAKTFDVSLEDLIYGGEISEEELVDEDNIDSNHRNLIFRKHNKNVLLSKILFFLLMAIIVIFIFIYYVYDNNSNSNFYYYADIYNSNISKSSIKISITSKYNNLKFDKIYSNDKLISKVVFYYKFNNKDCILFESENENYSITEYYGYNEYNLERVVKYDCYIKLIYDDNSFDVIKLKFKKSNLI